MGRGIGHWVALGSTTYDDGNRGGQRRNPPPRPKKIEWVFSTLVHILDSLLTSENFWIFGHGIAYIAWAGSRASDFSLGSYTPNNITLKEKHVFSFFLADYI